MKNNMLKIFYVLLLVFFLILPIIPAVAQETYNSQNHPGWRPANGNNYRANAANANNNQRGYYRGNYHNENPRQNYTFAWLQTGRNLIYTGRYIYEITDQTANFNNNQEVYALTKLVNISVNNHFRIKYTLYKNGNFNRDIYGDMNYPTYFWEYNYAWANFGNLPNGNYEIRSNINVDDRGYVELGRKSITVNNYSQNYNQNRVYSYNNSNYPFNNFRPQPPTRYNANANTNRHYYAIK